MFRILKPGHLTPSDEVVQIPDADPMPYFDETGAPEIRGMVHDEVYESVLRRAKEEAESLTGKIIGKAQEQCDAALAQAERDAETIRVQAWQEGYANGIKARVDEIDDCIRKVAAMIRQMREDQDAYFSGYASELKNFAADVALQVMLEKVDADDLALARLVRQAVHTIRDADWISIEVSEQLPGLVRHLEEELVRKDGGETRLEVSGVDLPRDGCRIQTADGVIDASVSTQIANLKELFAEIDHLDDEGRQSRPS